MDEEVGGGIWGRNRDGDENGLGIKIGIGVEVSGCGIWEVLLGR